MGRHHKQSSADPSVSLHSHKLRRECKDLPGEAVKGLAQGHSRERQAKSLKGPKTGLIGACVFCSVGRISVLLSLGYGK